MLGETTKRGMLVSPSARVQNGGAVAPLVHIPGLDTYFGPESFWGTLVFPAHADLVCPGHPSEWLLSYVERSACLFKGATSWPKLIHPSCKVSLVCRHSDPRKGVLSVPRLCVSKL